ncbi:MAG TPA: hypothetical protein VIX19_11655 [Terriglobales bacterium]
MESTQEKKKGCGCALLCLGVSIVGIIILFMMAVHTPSETAAEKAESEKELLLYRCFSLKDKAISAMSIDDLNTLKTCRAGGVDYDH